MINRPTSVPQKILDYQAVAKNIATAQKILIILPQRPSIDAVAASLALYLALKKHKKKVVIACAQPLTVAYNRLFAVDKIVTEVGNKNLVVSFPCSEDGLEKVSYNIDNNQFNLVIEPKEGQAPIKTKDISYSYTGVSADLVIIVGANKIEDLGVLYQGETGFFAETQVVNINSSAVGVLFGKQNIFDPEASSVSELAAGLIKVAELSVDADIATNLVAGIESATNNLAFKTRASTFEALSWLSKAGGQRGHLKPAAAPAPYQAQVAGPWGIQPPPFGASVSQPTPRLFSGQLPSTSVPPPFTNQPVNQAKPPVLTSQMTDNEQEPVGTEPDKETDGSIPKPDWFKPKIFKGKTRV